MQKNVYQLSNLILNGYTKMEIFDGIEYFDKKDYYKIMKEDILCNRNIIVKRLIPKNKKNINKKIDYSLFILEEDYKQEYGINYHFVQHSYKNNIVKEENLIGVSTISFDIDIGENKECKSKSEFYTRLNILKKNYGIYPHLIIKTTGGYHIYFNLSETFEYKIYKKVINKVYEFLIEKLLGDKGFKRKISQLKVIGSYDRSNKYTDPEKNGISIEKYSKHSKYNIEDIYNFYEKITGTKKNLIDDEKNAEENKERNNSFRYKINDLCPHEISKELGIYDADKKSIKGDNSIKIWYDKNLHKYCIKEHNGGKIDLYQIILNHFKGDFKELIKFIDTKYGIKYIKGNNYFEIPKIIFENIIFGNYELDLEKFKDKFGDEYKDILDNTEIHKNGKLNYKILFIILNLLTYYDKHKKSISIKDINFYDIFKNSGEKKENLHVNKKEYLKYFKIMECIYVNIKNYNINSHETEKIYFIDEFIDKGNNKYNISLLNKLSSKGYVNKLKNIPIYFKKSILKADKKILGFIILILLESDIRKSKYITYKDIYDSLGKTYNESYLRDIKHFILNILEKYNKNIKSKYGLYFLKDRVLLENINLKKSLQSIYGI